VFNTSQQIGGALGLAVLASLAGARTDHLLAGHHTQTAALTSGYHLAFLIAAGLVAAAGAVAAVLLRAPAAGGPSDSGPATFTAEADSGSLSASPGTRPVSEPADRKARA
jgi:hypothetical protein